MRVTGAELSFSAAPYVLLLVDVVLFVWLCVWPKPAATWRALVVSLVYIPCLALSSLLAPALGRKLSLWLIEWYLGPCPSFFVHPVYWVQYQYLESRALAFGVLAMPAALVLIFNLISYGIAMGSVSLVFFVLEELANRIPRHLTPFRQIVGLWQGGAHTWARIQTYRFFVAVVILALAPVSVIWIACWMKSSTALVMRA